jgi:adenylate cyclase
LSSASTCPPRCHARASRRNTETETVQVAQAALAAAKQEGLQLAVRPRYAALAVIAGLLPIINPNWDQLYYVILLRLFALIGWAQVRVGRVGLSRAELTLLFCGRALLTFIAVVPNPVSSTHWPVAAQYHFGNFICFFAILAVATLAYSWRTVIAVGTWTSALWIVGMVWVWWQPDRDPELTARIVGAIGGDQRLFQLVSPNSIVFGARIQEIIVCMIAAVTLAVAVRRSNDLLIRHAAVERERGNLARYFSPNMVEELSKNDEPLKQVRTQNVAVLFVDIVGFTAFADARTPQEVVRTLRQFHALMEQEVFRHSGTLDKYLGDGLMATFGTPVAGEVDASNALRCTQGQGLEPACGVHGRTDHRKLKTGQPNVAEHDGPVVQAKAIADWSLAGRFAFAAPGSATITAIYNSLARACVQIAIGCSSPRIGCGACAISGLKTSSAPPVRPSPARRDRRSLPARSRARGAHRKYLVKGLSGKVEGNCVLLALATGLESLEHRGRGW